VTPPEEQGKRRCWAGCRARSRGVRYHRGGCGLGGPRQGQNRIARATSPDEETLAWIRTTAAVARQVTSVCTGALLLAQAGLLAGRRATTHWAALDLLDSLGAGVTVERASRVVDDGVITSAGVASGIDMAFYIVETLFGPTVADETAAYIEYRRPSLPGIPLA
jgi:transcriptional regulator GlxA family with amidase domain